MSLSRSSTLVVAFVALGCARQTPGAKPHEMSAAQHEAMARREQAHAEVHAGRFDAGAREETTYCPERPGKTACWTGMTNPTKEHLEQAEEHRKRAADHRAASQALRDAEARACVGIPDADRDESPFDRRDDITSVDELYSPPSGAKTSTRRLDGATVVFRAVPGMTAQWLQRVIDCHLARNAALGHEVPEMPYCPLVLKGVTASVSPTQAGFAVAIKADSPEVAREVVRRARALAPR